MSFNNAGWTLQNIAVTNPAPNQAATLSPTDGMLGFSANNPSSSLYVLPALTEGVGTQISTWLELNSKQGCVVEILSQGYSGFLSIELSNDQNNVYNFYQDNNPAIPNQVVLLPPYFRFVRAKAFINGNTGTLNVQARVLGKEAVKDMGGILPGPLAYNNIFSSPSFAQVAGQLPQYVNSNSVSQQGGNPTTAFNQFQTNVPFSSIEMALNVAQLGATQQVLNSINDVRELLEHLVEIEAAK